MMQEIDEAEIITVSEKGQVVIPQKIRKEMKIKPRSKLLVYGKGNVIIMKPIELPDMKKEWQEIFRIMDGKNIKPMSPEEVSDIIHKYRKERRASQS